MMNMNITMRKSVKIIETINSQPAANPSTPLAQLLGSLRRLDWLAGLLDQA
jgi:hypothetical protein